jgi:hypothetical protein
MTKLVTKLADYSEHWIRTMISDSKTTIPEEARDLTDITNPEVSVDEPEELLVSQQKLVYSAITVGAVSGCIIPS